MQDRIIESADKQIKKYGLRRFTVDDIAQDLGISKKTIYKHFSSKKEIIGAVVDRAISLERKITDEALSGLSDWFDRLNAVVSVHSHANVPYRLIDEIYRYFPEEKDRVDRLGEYKIKVLEGLLVQGIREGRLRPDLNPRVVILVLDKIFFTPTDEEFLRENDLTVNQLLEHMKKIFFYGSLTEKEASRKPRFRAEAGRDEKR